MPFDFGGQLRPETNARLDTQKVGTFQNQIQLSRRFDHKKAFKTKLASAQTQIDKFRVFVTVTNDVTACFGQGGHGNQEFGFAASFKPVVVTRAESSNFLDDLRLLIDFDREDAAIRSLIIVFGNRTGKAVVEIADLQIDQVLDAQYHRQIHAAVFDTSDHVR